MDETGVADTTVEEGELTGPEETDHDVDPWPAADAVDVRGPDDRHVEALAGGGERRVLLSLLRHTVRTLRSPPLDVLGTRALPDGVAVVADGGGDDGSGTDGPGGVEHLRTAVGRDRPVGRIVAAGFRHEGGEVDDGVDVAQGSVQRGTVGDVGTDDLVGVELGVQLLARQHHRDRRPALVREHPDGAPPDEAVGSGHQHSSAHRFPSRPVRPPMVDPGSVRDRGGRHGDGTSRRRP